MDLVGCKERGEREKSCREMRGKQKSSPMPQTLMLVGNILLYIHSGMEEKTLVDFKILHLHIDLPFLDKAAFN